MTEWCKWVGLLEKDVKWYMLSWKKGTVLENKRAKMIWDFEFRTRKTTRARRPDVVLEDKELMRLYILDMACPMEENIEEKRKEKLTKHQQIAFEMRERRKLYEVKIVPIVIGILGGGGTKVKETLKNIFGTEKTGILAEMTKTLLWESESMIRKVLSGIIQE